MNLVFVLEGNVLVGESELLSADGQLELIVCAELVRELLLALVIEIVEVSNDERLILLELFTEDLLVKHSVRVSYSDWGLQGTGSHKLNFGLGLMFHQIKSGSV